MGCTSEWVSSFLGQSLVFSDQTAADRHMWTIRRFSSGIFSRSSFLRKDVEMQQRETCTANIQNRGAAASLSANSQYLRLCLKRGRFPQLRLLFHSTEPSSRCCSGLMSSSGFCGFSHPSSPLLSVKCSIFGCHCVWLTVSLLTQFWRQLTQHWPPLWQMFVREDVASLMIRVHGADVVRRKLSFGF